MLIVYDIFKSSCFVAVAYWWGISPCCKINRNTNLTFFLLLKYSATREMESWH